MRWLVLVLAACGPEMPDRKPAGEACTYERDCQSNRCVAQRCVSEEAFRAMLLDQSGVTAPVEAPKLEGSAATASAPVRLRTAKGNTPVFAACAQDERLVGGGCSGGTYCNNCGYVKSYPTSPDAADTIAGRWMCEDGRGEVTAHALCQRAR